MAPATNATHDIIQRFIRQRNERENGRYRKQDGADSFRPSLLSSRQIQQCSHYGAIGLHYDRERNNSGGIRRILLEKGHHRWWSISDNPAE